MPSANINTVLTEDLKVESGKAIQWFKEYDTVVNGKKFQPKIINSKIKTNRLTEVNMMTNTSNLTIMGHYQAQTLFLSINHRPYS